MDSSRTRLLGIAPTSRIFNCNSSSLKIIKEAFLSQTVRHTRNRCLGLRIKPAFLKSRVFSAPEDKFNGRRIQLKNRMVNIQFHHLTRPISIRARVEASVSALAKTAWEVLPDSLILVAIAALVARTRFRECSRPDARL